MKYVRGQKGHIHILGFLVTCLAIVGAWFVIKSYQENQLRQNMDQMLADYKRWSSNVVTGAQDKEEINRSFARIEEIVAKYKQGSQQ